MTAAEVATVLAVSTPIESSVELPFWLESVAISAGAVAGSLRGVRERLAISGVLALAVALGLGGGIIRDTLLQAGTPVALVDSRLLPVAVAASVPALVLAPVVNRIEWLVFATDTLAIGIYSVVGADKAQLVGVPPAGAILIGVLAGTGGSVLADMIVGVPPALFRPGHLLGISSALGTAVYVVATSSGSSRWVFFIVGVVLVTATRIVSVAAGWRVGAAGRRASFADGDALPARGAGRVRSRLADPLRSSRHLPPREARS